MSPFRTGSESLAVDPVDLEWNNEPVLAIEFSPQGKLSRLLAQAYNYCGCYANSYYADWDEPRQRHLIALDSESSSYTDTPFTFSGPYWLAPLSAGVMIKANSENAVRKFLLPAAVASWLAQAAEGVFCTVCQHVVDPVDPLKPREHCTHLAYAEYCSEWIGSGRGCNTSSIEMTGVQYLISEAKLGAVRVSELVGSLRSHRYDFEKLVPTPGKAGFYEPWLIPGCNFGGKGYDSVLIQDLSDYVKSSVGAKWLSTLESGKTPEADLLTADWLEEWAVDYWGTRRWGEVTGTWEGNE